MIIKQFSGTYFFYDDRIIFRFNTVDQSEYRFWLTRRVTHHILKFSNQFIEQQFNKQQSTIENVLSEFQSTPDNASPSFAKEYEPGNQYPIGADAVLVMDVKCEAIQIDSKDLLSLNFLLPGGANLNLKLPSSTMNALLMLLEELNMQAKWGR